MYLLINYMGDYLKCPGEKRTCENVTSDKLLKVELWHYFGAFLHFPVFSFR